MNDQGKTSEQLIRELIFPVLEMMPATICLQAPDYTIRYANRLFKDTFGDPQGRACYEVLHGRSDPCEECMPFRVLETGEPEVREWTSLDGGYFLVHYYPFEDAHGGRLVLEMGLDISERKRAEDLLKESELALRRITDNMLDIVGQADSRGLFTYVSPSYHDVLGYEREELLGHSVFELTHPDELKGIVEAFMQAGQALRPGKAEYRCRRADGRYIWLETIGSPLFDEAGELLGVTFTSRDVTDRREAEEALRDSEEKFRLLSDQSLVGIHIIQDGRVKYANEATARIAGYPREEIMTWGPEEYSRLVHPDDLPFVLDQVRKKEAGDADVVPNYQWRAVNRAGETRWIESFSRTIHYGKGLADFAMIIDITDRHNLEEERRARTEQMRDFLDIASHELRHPITVLKGYTSILANQGDQLDEGTREVIHSIIDHAADRLNSLVTGLLDISHIERDKFKINPGRHALEPIIGRALGEMKVRGFNNEFAMKIVEDLPECYIDAEKLEQLLVILLENAVKYSTAGSPIEVETDTSAGEIMVCVADRGIGIPEDARESVFERFYQVEDTSHHSKPGMGMGLYIAHHIVEAHGGRIWCEPRPDGGTLMRFTIPL